MVHPTQARPFTCNYCKREGYVRETGLDKHVRNEHPEFAAIYESDKREAIRAQKRALDEIPGTHLHLSMAKTVRKTAQDAYFETLARRLFTQSQANAGEHDIDAPEPNSEGEADTYLPHQVKSKTKRTSLGPRRTGASHCPVLVVDRSVWEGDDLEDVPEDEMHSFNPRQAGFNPFYPFPDGADFKKAQWFINSRMADSAITNYFNDGIGTAKSFQSPHALHRLIDEMDPALDDQSWAKGEATFIADRKNAKQPYFFRDLESSIRFLMEQPCFKDYMVYAPVKEYSGDLDDLETKRYYTEPNTGEHWHEEQVSKPQS